MAKTIDYKVKYTKATTQYIQIKSSDRKYIHDELVKIKEFINECKTFDHPEISRVLYETTAIDKNLPKKGIKPYNHNSMYSYIDGLLHNLTIGGQRDLTINNIEPIEYITEYTESNLYDFSKIVFKKI